MSGLYCDPHGRLKRACEVCQLKGTEEAERAKDGPSGTAFLPDAEKDGVVLTEPTPATPKGKR